MLSLLLLLNHFGHIIEEGRLGVSLQDVLLQGITRE